MKLLIIFFIIGFIFLTSCNDNGVNNNQHKFTKSSFPVAAGNWWRYQVIDSLNNNAIDTIVIKVDSSVNIDGVEQFKCHLEQNNETIDTALISLNDTLLSFVENLNPDNMFGTYYFKLPFSLGSKWSIEKTLIDSFFVISFNINFSLLERNYKNVYFIKSRINDSIGGNLQTYQIAENIGIIYRSIYIYNNLMTLYNKQFNLIDYKLE